MWWNQIARRWEKHPDCTCGHEQCVCRWLRPLDVDGTPIPSPLMDQMRAAERTTAERDALFTAYLHARGFTARDMTDLAKVRLAWAEFQATPQHEEDEEFSESLADS